MCNHVLGADAALDQQRRIRECQCDEGDPGDAARDAVWTPRQHIAATEEPSVVVVAADWRAGHFERVGRTERGRLCERTVLRACGGGMKRTS